MTENSVSENIYLPWNSPLHCLAFILGHAFASQELHRSTSFRGLETKEVLCIMAANTRHPKSPDPAGFTIPTWLLFEHSKQRRQSLEGEGTHLE